MLSMVIAGAAVGVGVVTGPRTAMVPGVPASGATAGDGPGVGAHWDAARADVTDGCVHTKRVHPIRGPAVAAPDDGGSSSVAVAVAISFIGLTSQSGDRWSRSLVNADKDATQTYKKSQ